MMCTAGVCDCYTEDTSATRPVMTLPSDGVGCVDEEREFVWDDYLNDTKSVAVPATSFKHVRTLYLSLLFTSDRGGGNFFCPCLFVCLSLFVGKITQKRVHGFGCSGV